MIPERYRPSTDLVLRSNLEEHLKRMDWYRPISKIADDLLTFLDPYATAAAEKAARAALKDVGDVVTALEATVERLTTLHDYSERDAERGPEVGCSVCFAILQGREALGQLPASLRSGKGKEGE